MSAFERGAAYYDALANRPGRLEREGPLLLDCLAQAPSRRVADLACGTGLHARYLAGHEAEVMALDLSEGMIAFARAKRPHARIEYATGDMRTVTGGPYGLVLILGNSLALLGEESGLAAVMRSTAAALADNGLLLLQLSNGLATEAQKPRQRIERVPLDDASGDLVVVKSLVPHAGRMLLSIAYFVMHPDAPETLSEAAVLRLWTREELLAVATAAGLVCRAVFGGFDQRPFDRATAPDLLLLLERP